MHPTPPEGDFRQALAPGCSSDRITPKRRALTSPGPLGGQTGDGRSAAQRSLSHCKSVGPAAFLSIAFGQGEDLTGQKPQPLAQPRLEEALWSLTGPTSAPKPSQGLGRQEEPGVPMPGAVAADRLMALAEVLKPSAGLGTAAQQTAPAAAASVVSRGASAAALRERREAAAQPGGSAVCDTLDPAAVVNLESLFWQVRALNQKVTMTSHAAARCQERLLQLETRLGGRGDVGLPMRAAGGATQSAELFPGRGQMQEAPPQPDLLESWPGIDLHLTGLREELRDCLSTAFRKSLDGAEIEHARGARERLGSDLRRPIQSLAERLAELERVKGIMTQVLTEQQLQLDAIRAEVMSGREFAKLRRDGDAPAGAQFETAAAPSSPMSIKCTLKALVREALDCEPHGPLSPSSPSSDGAPQLREPSSEMTEASPGVVPNPLVWDTGLSGKPDPTAQVLSI